MKILIVILLTSTPLRASNKCHDWFAREGIKPGPGCLVSCFKLPKLFDFWERTCTIWCPQFCYETSVYNKAISNFGYYPGLTDKEKKLVREYPGDARTVFEQKEKAESSTFQRFKRDAQNDESDAYRHFVWAANLSKELGPERAKEFLDAHEQGSKDSAMDHANNAAGLRAADRLRHADRLTDQEIEEAAMNELRNGKLRVLQPRGLP